MVAFITKSRRNGPGVDASGQRNSFTYEVRGMIDRIKHGYDRAPNRIWRENTVATAAKRCFDSTESPGLAWATPAYDPAGNMTTIPNRQFMWGMRYIDDCVLRDRGTSGSGTLDERLSALQDGNWNVTSVTDKNGDVQERHAYTAYGEPLFLTPGFVEQSGSSFGWEVVFGGHRWDAHSSVLVVRSRLYHPVLGCWIQRDVLGYLNGINLFQYANSEPTGTVDPLGYFGCRAFGRGLVKGLITGAVVTAVIVAVAATAPAAVGAGVVYAAVAVDGALAANEAVQLARGKETFTGREIKGDEWDERLGCFVGAALSGRTVARALPKVFPARLGSLLSPARGKVGTPYSGRRVSGNSKQGRYAWKNVRMRWFKNRAPQLRDNPGVNKRGVEFRELSHWIFRKSGRAPAWLKNSRFNLKEMWSSEHAMADPARWQFMQQNWKGPNTQFGPGTRFLIRTPEWAFSGALGLSSSGLPALMGDQSDLVFDRDFEQGGAHALPEQIDPQDIHPIVNGPANRTCSCPTLLRSSNLRP